VRSAGKTCGQRKLAKASGISLSEVSAILLGKRRLTRTTLAKLCQAIPRLEREASEEAEQVQGTRDMIHRYITPSEEEFGLPFDLWESRQQPGQ
jgi:transcriptional regulator with XRE-family HTH domain